MSKYDHDEIVRRFKNGESTGQIAKDLGIKNYRIVGGILRSKGIKQKEHKTKVVFSKADIQDILRRYNSGEGQEKIGKDYDCSYNVINRLIKKHLDDSMIRKSKPAFTEEEGQKLKEEYERGEGTITHKMLSEKYGGSISSVRTAIMKAGGIGRGSGPPPVLTKEQEKEICKRYEESELPAMDIGKEFGVCESTVLNAVRNSGGEVRPSGTERSLSESDVLEAKRFYEMGETLAKIGERYGLTDAAIRNYLLEVGTEMREVGTPLETMQDAIEGRGRFLIDEEAELYVYTINGHSDQLKVGIKLIRTDRAKHSKGFYKDKIFSVIYPTRREVFYLEQAILADTQKYYKPPLEMIEYRNKRGQPWAGISELRCISFEDLSNYIDFYLAEIEELGAHLFAEKYLPLTAKQKARCRELAANESDA